MTIPVGVDYGFTITVMEKESFLPQDLTNMLEAKFKLIVLASDPTLMTCAGEVLGTRVETVTFEYTETSDTTTAAYLVGTYVKNTTSGIIYYCKSDSTIGDLLTGVNFEPAAYRSGQVYFVLPSLVTSALVTSRGEAVDNYYLKPSYQGVITVTFSDGTPSRTAVVEKIYVAPLGASCV